ncbi:MAG: 50S ribosomal protein L28 [Rickettsiales bacterium]|nr:50S ribosomal protein L28 [Rickettsiales bacterium]
MSRKCEILGIGVMSGNNVSHSNRKTKRRFLPNLKNVSLKSEALGVAINIKVAAATLRTINKYGSIDNFLVNYRFSKLSAKAQKLRNQIKKKLIKIGKLDDVKIVNEKKVNVAKASRRQEKKKAVSK